MPAASGEIALRAAAAIAGVLIIFGAIISAIKTFVIPRGMNVWLTRWVFRFLFALFNIRLRKATAYEDRDRVMTYFAPVGVFLLPLVLLALVLVGYMFLYWAMEPQPLYDIFRLSGSSLLTLGYASHEGWWFKLVEFSEATLGLILVALLIAYLPTMYSAFSRREALVAQLETLTGSPPTAVTFITRAYRTGQLEGLHEIWTAWRIWFAEVEESHTSLAPLSFFRSPKPERNWVTSAGAVLDTASMILSVVDVPFDPRLAFTIRGGFLSLRHIADFFEIEHNRTPQPDDPISISRLEFDDAVQQLAEAGVPLKPDLEQAWRDFSGWRVNYDTVLIRLAAMTMAPYAPWSSDRSVVGDMVTA